MFPLAKIVIPFVVYPHPMPWIFLAVSVLLCGVGLVRFYGGESASDPTVKSCAAVFCYSGYHMVGGFFNGMDPTFAFGLIGTGGSVLVALATLRAHFHESLQIEADEPRRQHQLRQDGIRNLVRHLGCSEEEGARLLDHYDGDDVRALMEARAGRLNTGSTEALASGSQPPVEPGERVEGSPFDPVNGFVLLQMGSQAKDVGRMARLLSAVTELNVVDAGQQLRAHRGAVILPNLKEPAADAFMRALQQDGIAVIKMPVRDMLRFAFAGEVKALSYGSDGLQVVTTKEESMTIPWEQMILFSVGLFNATAVPDINGLVDARKGLLCGDLFILEADNRCLQFAIDSKRLTYAHLGDRMQTNAFANFRLTVADIVERAPHLLQNASVDALLQKSMAKSFRSPEDFAGESSGLLQLVQAARLGAASSS